MRSPSKSGQEFSAPVMNQLRLGANAAVKVLVAGAALLCTSVGYTNAAEAFPIQCSLRDAQVLMRIEQHAEAGDIKPEQLGSAFVKMLDARAVCGAQGEAEALALYDSALPSTVVTAAQK